MKDPVFGCSQTTVRFALHPDLGCGTFLQNECEKHNPRFERCVLSILSFIMCTYISFTLKLSNLEVVFIRLFYNTELTAELCRVEWRCNTIGFISRLLRDLTDVTRFAKSWSCKSVSFYSQSAGNASIECRLLYVTATNMWQIWGPWSQLRLALKVMCEMTGTAWN
jgi:hypothetical protein